MGRAKGMKGSEPGNAPMIGKKNSKGRGKERGSLVGKTGFEGSITAPWRKTVSIFKQPVTLVHTSKRDTKICKNEDVQTRRTVGSVSGKAERPSQLFWSKRLEGLSAMIPLDTFDRFDGKKTEYISNNLELANKVEPAISIFDEQATSASLLSSLNSFTAPAITGQETAKKDSNPWNSIDTDQPFIKPLEVREKDIQLQEERVLMLRRRLQEARKLI